MRILILSASTGGGHMKASSAIKDHILKKDKSAIIKISDILKYISPILDKTISDGYEYLAKKAPKMYGVMYKQSNKETALNSFVYKFNTLFSKKLIPLLEDFKPDAIVSTHPFTTEMFSSLKDILNIKIPLICVITDYAPHKAWLNKNVDAYVVASNKMVDAMVDIGIDQNIIYPYGIPIEDSFFTKRERIATLKEIGLLSSLPTILIMAGSFGVTDILKIYNRIIKINIDFQIIIITGRNKKLYESFEKILYRNKDNPILTFGKHSIKKPHINKSKKDVPSKNTKLIYFTNEVSKYMFASDLIITKPGGLTISEALACNLPMAIFNAIPGQEEENADFLIDNNMAVRLGKGSSCEKTIQKLLSDRYILESMRASCETFDKSASCNRIYNLIKELVCKNNSIKQK